MRKAVHLSSVHTALDTRILHRECASLVRAGFDVVLIAAHPGDEVVRGVRIRALARPASRRQRMSGGVWSVYRAALEEGPAIFHLHDPELLPLAPLLRARGWPVIYDAHEVLPHQIRAKYWIPSFLRPAVAMLGSLAEQWASVVCTAVVAATPDIARRFRLGPTVLVQNFPEAGEFHHAAAVPYASRPATVAYVGAIAESRGAVEMVAAMALVDPALGATLALAGDFAPRDLRERLEATAGWARCRALGRLDRPAVVQILSEARIGLVLLHPTPSYLRSFPVKMFEYMAAGVPIIASDFPLWRELLARSDCAVFVDPLDPAAIAAAIGALLSDPERGAAMARRAVAAARSDFAWAGQEERLVSLYRQVASGGRASV